MKTDITVGERKLLSSIKTMPGMYIGSKKLTYLEHFIHGYNSAMFFLGIKDQHNIMPDGFQEYIVEKYNISVYTPKNYFSIISENTPDDEQAFDVFFQLLDEYLESIGYEVIHEWDSKKDSINQLLSLLSLSNAEEELKPEE